MADHSKQIEKAEEEVSKWARLIALKRGAAIAVVGFLLTIAVERGWINSDISKDALTWVSAGFVALGAVGTGAWIHQSATPSSDALQPRNQDGVLLVPDTELTASVEEASDDDSVDLHSAVTAPDA